MSPSFWIPRHFILLIPILTLVLTWTAFSAATAAFQTSEATSSETYIFGFQPGISEEQSRQLLLQSGWQPQKFLPQLNIWVASPEQKTARTALSLVSEENLVSWAELNGIVRASDIIPNDPYFTYTSATKPHQANFAQIGMPTAWEYSTGDSAVIAVIDTGISFSHPDLAPRIWSNPGEIERNGIDDDHNGYIDDKHGWNFVRNNASPVDDHGHGSHVSGILGAVTNNGIGVAGVTWLNPIMPLKSLGRDGSGSYADTAEAILYASDNGARVINISLGDVNQSTAILYATEYAYNHGCLIVAAAGNDAGPVQYPGANPHVLTVAAVDSYDIPASFSNRGPEVDVAAPGVGIWSTDRTSSVIQLSGTSMATPHVSGAAALVWSLHPAWTHDEVAYQITSTVKDVWGAGFDELSGWGRLNVSKALAPPRVPLIFNLFIRLDE